ncbi:hypothetical protein TSUD_46780 [Trifolium subterraneum]|nr:hypothetical protein TSUD_46780 [Trifolium subterraneum]
MHYYVFLDNRNEPHCEIYKRGSKHIDVGGHVPLTSIYWKPPMITFQMHHRWCHIPTTTIYLGIKCVQGIVDMANILCQELISVVCFFKKFDQCEIWGLHVPLHNGLGFTKMSSPKVSKLQETLNVILEGRHSSSLVRTTGL